MDDNKESKKIKVTHVLLSVFICLVYGLFLIYDPSNTHIIADSFIPVITFGFMITAVVLTGIRAKQLGRSAAGWAVGSFFTALVPSIVLLFLGKKKEKLLKEASEERMAAKEDRRIEQAILSCAKQNKGYVKVSIVAMEANITMEEAQKELDELVKKGFARMDVEESGVLRYSFPDFMEGNG